MDATLSQILRSLYEAHATIDALRREAAEKDKRIAALEAATKRDGMAPPKDD